MSTVTDPIADMLTRIRNANTANHEVVEIPASKLKRAIVDILKDEGFINDYEMRTEGPQGVLRIVLKYGPEKEKVITGLRRISRPGLRVYSSHRDLPRVLGGMSLLIVSTPRGLLTNKDARREQVGGEVSGLDPRIRHILDLLATDLTNAHEVAELAGRVALSPSRLAHLFRAQMGNSVLDTLLQMRLHQAARLLKYTTQGIGEISRVVGFRSPYYFSRQFHQRYGLSASAYRAAVAHIPMHQAVGAVAQLSSDTLSPVPTRGRGAQQ